MMLPVVPSLVVQILGDKAIPVTSVFSSASSFLGFLFSPLVGALADPWGRRPTMIILTVTQAVQFLPLLWSENIWLCLTLTLLSGFGGALNGIMYAFISDCVPQEKRPQVNSHNFELSKYLVWSLKKKCFVIYHFKNLKKM